MTSCVTLQFPWWAFPLLPFFFPFSFEFYFVFSWVGEVGGIGGVTWKTQRKIKRKQKKSCRSNKFIYWAPQMDWYYRINNKHIHQGTGLHAVWTILRFSPASSAGHNYLIGIWKWFIELKVLEEECLPLEMSIFHFSLAGHRASLITSSELGMQFQLLWTSFASFICVFDF